MGRHYSGDINGKFWVAVQSSSDADFFGVNGQEPNHLQYYFDAQEDLEAIKEGIAKCEEALGEYETKFDKFFEEHNGYNNQMLEEEFDLEKEKVADLLRWYARLGLGKKILKCVEEQGYCEFDAEM